MNRSFFVTFVILSVLLAGCPGPREPGEGDGGGGATTTIETHTGISGAGGADGGSSSTGGTGGAAPDPCDDGNPCTVDKMIDGVCQHAPAPEGMVCGDGKVCSSNICVDACASSADCDDSNPCTVDVCGPSGPAAFCHHSPASGHNKCGNGGWCADKQGACCDGGCNAPASGGGFVCVSACPLGSVCFDGFCI